MKRFNKFSAALLAIILLLSANFTIVLAAAEDGIGTEASPYLIRTAEELQSINDDVTAHYKLAADIDLQEKDFTPIGNTDTGAFTGSFDGNDYTISNLNVFAGKYAGLFGYNEGLIKNVTLSDVFVYGTRYVGALVAYNDGSGIIKNCSVLSGEIESDGGLNWVMVGGICGVNNGIMTGEFSNGAHLTVNSSRVIYAAGICAHNVGKLTGTFSNTGNVYANCVNNDAYAGGVLAVSSSAIEITATNSGDISSNSHAGGIGAYFSKFAKLTNCYNSGAINGINNEDIAFSYYLGGIGGRFLASTELSNCYNSGSISSLNTSRTAYTGGIGGYFDKEALINKCYNSGDIQGQYVGGIGGKFNKEVSIMTCYNTGVIASGNYTTVYVGGIGGCFYSVVDLQSSYNIGQIIAKTSGGDFYSYAGGIGGYFYQKSNIIECYNTGSILAGSNRGTYSYDMLQIFTGGIGGYFDNYAILSLCYNTGYINSKSYGAYYVHFAYSGGLIGWTDNESYINQSYNTGCIRLGVDDNYGGSFVGHGSSEIVNSFNLGAIIFEGSESFDDNYINNPEMIDCYTLSGRGDEKVGATSYKSTIFMYPSDTTYGETNNILSPEQMKDSKSFKGWDFENIWDIDSNVNSGFPFLRNAPCTLSINTIAHTMKVGESYQFSTYKNGSICSDVLWSVDNDGIITTGGLFTAHTPGVFVVNAVDSYNNRISAVVRVIEENRYVTCQNFSTSVNTSSKRYLEFGLKSYYYSFCDFLVNIKSSNPDVFRIDNLGENWFEYSSISAGKATITFETAQGLTGSCVVTVTNAATAISLNYSSVTVNRGSTKQLTATVTPNPTSSNVIWTSSDTNVATVDEYGLVSAVGKGTATITCKTNNGYSASCTVTVKAPATEIVFDEPEVTIYVGDTKELTFTVTPADTTDGISSITTSNTSYLPIQTWNSCSCTVKGVSTGTQTITVKMSNGLTATCKVKVLPVPVVVTSVSLNATSRAMLVGEKYKLNATIHPTNSTDKSVEWTSTDETVATVSDTGYITALGAGETVITASASNGVVAHCTVTVTDPANNKLPIIYIPDTIVTDGEYFDIPIMLENNPGINKAVFSVQYDKAKVEPVSVTNGEVFDYTTATTNKDESKVNLYFAADTDKYANGVLATLKFKILLPDAGDAEFKLCYTPNDFISSTQEKVEFETEDGVAVIACSHNNTEIRNAVKNSCTTNGYTGDKYCLDCSKIVVEGAVILSTGHEWNDWHTTVEPTFTTDGNTARTCATCGETENEVIEQLTNAKVTEGFIYGLSCGLTVQEFEKQFNSDYISINIEPSFGTTVGTGSTVTATYANGTSDTLTAVIFGDVNGDGWYDGEDAFLVNMIVIGMLSKDNCSQALCIAADCNRDGVINESDVDLLMGAGVKKNDIDQSIPHEELAVNSSFIEYSSLINQSTELIIDSENQTTESESTPESSDSEISSDSTEKPVQEITTENIWINTFWGIFKKIFSFILQLFNLI